METATLKALIKESIREVLLEERLMICHVLMPYVSDKEQAEIDAQFGSHSKISQDILSGIETIAQQFNLSVNELLEKISQGQLTVIEPEELEDLLDLQDALEAENNPENKNKVSWEVIKQNLIQE